MDLRLSCLFLVCLSLPGLVNGGEIRNITVTGHWKKIFEEMNNTTSPIEYTRRHSYGLTTTSEDERTVTARASNSANFGFSIGDILQILSINFGIGFQDERSSSFRTLTRTQIHRHREQTVKFTVPPWTKMVRWQFVVDIVGNEYDHSFIWTLDNDEVPRDFNVRVTVMLRKREIHFGRTRIRIKHKSTNKYMTIVERENWPAAKLGLSKRYHFILNNYSNNDAVTIKTLNSMHPGYDYLHTWLNVYCDGLSALSECFRMGDDWIYGDTFEEFYRSRRLYWFVSRESPLYDGDIVTFKSKAFDHPYLCHNSESIYYAENGDVRYRYATDIHTRTNREDEWILEVV